MNWRLIDSDLSEPAFTFAADEAIALARSQGIVPNTLHLYRRNAPTISLGYFQKADKALDLEFCRKYNIRILRRVTGGSAIYTDPGHLIYGLALDEKGLPAGRNEVFELVCSGIVLALENLGLQAEFKPVNDVLINGRKISGSAQKRAGGVVLQHGTLVLKNNREMMMGALRMDMEKIRSRRQEPETYVTSLAEELGREPDIAVVKKSLVSGFEEVLDADFHVSAFTEFERTHIDGLIEQKYGRDEWNLRRMQMK